MYSINHFRTCRSNLTFLIVFAIGLAGCEPADDLNPNVNPDELTMTANTHPDDELLGSVAGPAGEAFIYGSKSTGGVPEHVESMILTDAESGVTYVAQFDEEDRPTFVADDLGNSIAFTYSDTHIGIDFRPSGNEEAVNLSIPIEEVPDWPPTLDGKPRHSDKTRTDTWEPSTRGHSFVIAANVYLTYQGQRVGSHSRATVRGLIDYGLNYKRRFYDAEEALETGIYLFDHWHQYEPEDTDRARCEEWANVSNTAGRVLTHAGTGIATLAVMCLAGSALVGGATSPLCLFLAKLSGATLALGVSAGSSIATEIPNLVLDCESQQVVPADPPLANIRVFVDPNIFEVEAKEQEIPVDFSLIRDQNVIEFDFEFEVDAQVIAITADPLPPPAGNRYRILFVVSPPGAGVEWTLSGSDGFTTGGTAQAAPGEISVYSDYIPGGAATVKDTISGTIVIDGQKIGPTETNRFEFQ